MTDDRFDELMRDAEKTYRTPPQPDFDAMWKGIEAAHFGGAAERPSMAMQRRGLSLLSNRWVGIAATLLIGIGVGRASTLIGRTGVSVAPATVALVEPAPSAPTDTTMGRPYEMETSRYLGQTAALLIALPSEVKAGRAAEQFASRAGDLLTRTRLLMDSPAANDPAMRSLLDDLELVLMQVARLQNNGSRIELDIINRALEQRDVIPRLRTAVADISAN
jgi:hypothetical protein